jgi:hypothetical protein
MLLYSRLDIDSNNVLYISKTYKEDFESFTIREWQILIQINVSNVT